MRPIALALAALTALPLAPARAATENVYVVSLTGTVEEPLTATPATHHYAFGGPATLLLNGTTTCSFSALGLFDSLSEGVGTFWGDCGTEWFFTCAYVRIGPAMTVACADGATRLTAGELVFQPISVTAPVTEFTLTGAFVFAKTS